ncbi:hypothetical protein AAOE16_03415 [Ekhidna sp. MALMAid0563]|uniref:hypothetical protein n=1 Tax=Ekhidna sp. MALMAid0563 TaxID=3143937 RepID=UPI0032E00BFC
MRPIILLFLLDAFAVSCGSKSEDKPIEPIQKEAAFDSEQWKAKQEDEYPFRPYMYKEILYSDSVRTLSKPEIITLLGKPEKEENNHFYYLIEANTIGSFTLNQKSLVLKFKPDDSVEWIKLYE